MPPVKLKFSLCLTKHHTMEYWGSGGITPHILNFGTRWRWVYYSIFVWNVYYLNGKKACRGIIVQVYVKIKSNFMNIPQWLIMLNIGTWNKVQIPLWCNTFIKTFLVWCIFNKIQAK